MCAQQHNGQQPEDLPVPAGGGEVESPQGSVAGEATAPWLRAAMGDVVQIDPDHDTTFGAAFMVVTEVKGWGYVGYVQVPGRDGVAWYRLPTAAARFVGPAPWSIE